MYLVVTLFSGILTGDPLQVPRDMAVIHVPKSLAFGTLLVLVQLDLLRARLRARDVGCVAADFEIYVS